jgi:acyl transferase domain-containing protein
MLADGYRTFIECSPHPVLTTPVEQILESAADGPGTRGETGRALSTLRRGEDDRLRFLTSAAEAFVHGVPVDWTSFHQGGQPVDLPTYPFQHRRYWLDDTGVPASRAAANGTGDARDGAGDGTQDGSSDGHSDAGDGTFLARLLSGRSEDAQHLALLELVRVEVAAVLGHDSPTEVTPRRPFSDLGFTSLGAMELRNRLRAKTGLPLRTTLVFTNPTPDALARHLRELAAIPAADGDAAAVLDALAGLEGAVAAGAGDADRSTRGEVTARIEALLRLWRADGAGPAGEAGNGTGHGSGNGAGSAPEVLTAATDDEMFALIDKQLGNP